jgi:hypothetical protein
LNELVFKQMTHIFKVESLHHHSLVSKRPLVGSYIPKLTNIHKFLKKILQITIMGQVIPKSTRKMSKFHYVNRTLILLALMSLRKGLWRCRQTFDRNPQKPLVIDSEHNLTAQPSDQDDNPTL